MRRWYRSHEYAESRVLLNACPVAMLAGVENLCDGWMFWPQVELPHGFLAGLDGSLADGPLGPAATPTGPTVRARADLAWTASDTAGSGPGLVSASSVGRPRGPSAAVDDLGAWEVRQLRQCFVYLFILDASLTYHAAHPVWCPLLGARAYGMLIGACNPML